MASARFREKGHDAQAALFHDCFEDAIGSAIQASGGVKRVASLLWPNEPIARSESKLRDCLNTDRPQKLSLSELLRLVKLAREANDHSILNYVCAECGYEAPRAVSPEDQREQLQRQVLAAAADLKVLLKRLDV